MLKTRHNNERATGIRTLGIEQNPCENPESPTGTVTTTMSHGASGWWSLNLQFHKIEDLQALVNEARALLDAWMVDELESSAKTAK